ncbi:MAG: LOG family protein, partial [Myxococcota bacterium]
WAQLGIHRKPIGLLNIKGYYDALLRMMDHMVKEGFLPEEYRVLFVDATEPVHLFEQLEALEMPESILRWMGIEQS